jgi:hypothetical protein
MKWMTSMALMAAAAGAAALACGASASNQGGTSKPCAHESLAAVSSGYYSTTYAISDRIENCSTEDETVEVEFSFKHEAGAAGAACPADPPSQTAKSDVPAGTTSSISISAAMPNCPGATYSVTAHASSGGHGLATSTIPLPAASSGGGGSKGGGGGADDGSPHP